MIISSMLTRKQKYDLVFSLGEACACTQTLRKAKLQNNSYPLDWLYGADFLGRTEILCSGFDDFINLEDLEYFGKNKSSNNPCYDYKNTRNNINFNHDFPCGTSLEDSYPKVREKYDSRIKRLLQGIESAQRVLIVYLETPNCKSKLSNTQTLLGAYKKISDKFKGCEIDLVYIAQNNDIEYDDKKTEQVNENIILHTLNFKSKKENALPYEADMKMLKKLFKNYRLKLPLTTRLKNLVRHKK